MKIINTRINGIEHPIGFRYDYVTCSWQVTETEAKRQGMAKVEVSLSPDFSRSKLPFCGSNKRKTSGQKQEKCPKTNSPKMLAG